MSRPAEHCTSCGKEMLEGALFCTFCSAERMRAPAFMTQDGSRQVYEVKKVGIGSLVKLSFMINALAGLILGIFVAGIGLSGLPIPLEGADFLGPGLWIVAVIAVPVFYGLVGALFGLIMGFLYNLLAWTVGGIRITLKSK